MFRIPLYISEDRTTQTELAQYSLAGIPMRISQKPFLCFLYDSSPVFGDFYYEACKNWTARTCAGSSTWKL